MNTSQVGRSITHWATASTVFMVTCLGVLACRLVYIDTTDGRKLLAHRERQQSRTMVLPARRGLIVDRQGCILAGSMQCPSVFADSTIITDPEETAKMVSAVLGIPVEVILDQIVQGQEKNNRFVVLARRILPVEEEALRAYHRDNKLRGIGLFDEPRRVYPNGRLLAQVLGFVGRDNEGLEGLERFYDDTLTGTAGRRSVKCANNRQAIWSSGEDIKEPEQGFHVVLTIDLIIQEMLEQRVADVLEDFEAESAVGIIIDPRSGDILAMTSQPTFDPNRFSSSNAELYRNRCLTDPVEPGSVFKPFIVAAALSEGVATPQEEIDCGEGYYYFGKRRIRDTHPNGVITVEQILVKSSNIGMGKLADRLGNTHLHDYVCRFGFGRQTHVDLPAENGGILNGLSRWSGYSTQSVAIGQELAVTPIQLVSAFGALVNGGTLYRPRVVSRIIDPESLVHYEQPPTVVRQVLDPDIARTVAQRMMVRVVDESHHDIHSRSYSILGKTGTAQVPRTDGRGYEPDAYLSSFIGAAPAAQPRLAVVVMVRKPKVSKGYYGGLVAGPVVRDVLESALSYLNVPPDKPTSMHVATPQNVESGYAGLGPADSAP